MANKVPASVANPKRSDKIPAWIAFHRCLSGNMEKRIFHMKRQSGFTLIELMIVVAIVAILAAIAMPAYQNYSRKAKMTELVTATGAQKTAIEVCVQTKSVADCTPGTNGIANVTPSAAASTGLPTIAVDVTGNNYTITAAASADQSPLTEGETYKLTGDASNIPIAWSGSCAKEDGTANTDYCPN